MRCAARLITENRFSTGPPRAIVLEALGERDVGTAQTPLLPDQLYTKLQDCLGFELGEGHRRKIEAGIGWARVGRDLQLDELDERRNLFADIEQASKAFNGKIRQALGHPSFAFWVLLYGGDERLSIDVLTGKVEPSAYLHDLAKRAGIVKHGVTRLLKNTPKGRGASPRRDRDLMCCFIAEVISDAAGWSHGAHDLKIVARFARLLFPHLPESIAHKSARAFAEDLCRAFNTPHFGWPEKCPSWVI